MSSINERLKELRKKEGLSQRAFGKKIFLSQDQISLLEKGRRTLTERSINDICREFYVNEDWLVYGIGDMYSDYLKDVNVENEVKEITKYLYELEEEDRDAILNMIKVLKNKKVQ